MWYTRSSQRYSQKYLQFQNGQVGKAIIFARLELVIKILGEDAQILGVVSVDAGNQILDLLRSSGRLCLCKRKRIVYFALH